LIPICDTAFDIKRRATGNGGRTVEAPLKWKYGKEGKTSGIIVDHGVGHCFRAGMVLRHMMLLGISADVFASLFIGKLR
jgi:hypothetical protein